MPGCVVGHERIVLCASSPPPQMGSGAHFTPALGYLASARALMDTPAPQAPPACAILQLLRLGCC